MSFDALGERRIKIMTDCDNFVELTFWLIIEQNQQLLPIRSIYAPILNLVNKLNPKKGCSPILFLPMNEREWKYTEKADMPFSIFTVLLYVF